MHVVGGIILSLQINDFTFFCGFIPLICFISPLISMHPLHTPPSSSHHPLPHPTLLHPLFLSIWELMASMVQKKVILSSGDDLWKKDICGSRVVHAGMTLVIKYDVDLCYFVSRKTHYLWDCREPNTRKTPNICHVLYGSKIWTSLLK